jgi:hypothetical protein
MRACKEARQWGIFKMWLDDGVPLRCDLTCLFFRTWLDDGVPFRGLATVLRWCPFKRWFDDGVPLGRGLAIVSH